MASTGSNQRSELTGMSQLVRVKIVDFEGRVVVENKERRQQHIFKSRLKTGWFW
jgi:hypothetical protein